MPDALPPMQADAALIARFLAVIERAAEAGDAEFLQSLDAFLHDAMRRLRQSHEAADRASERRRSIFPSSSS